MSLKGPETSGSRTPTNESAGEEGERLSRRATLQGRMNLGHTLRGPVIWEHL